MPFPTLIYWRDEFLNFFSFSGITDFGLPLAFIQPFASTLPFLNGQLAQNRQFIPQPASSSATATATITSMNALSPSLICAANKQRYLFLEK
jgi:hypothetical protein